MYQVRFPLLYSLLQQSLPSFSYSSRLLRSFVLLIIYSSTNLISYRYWGKRDTTLILPTNSSLSVTLSQDHLRSTTTSRADPAFTETKLWLNGKEEDIKSGGRLERCLKELKKMRKERIEDKEPNAPKVKTIIKLNLLSFTKSWTHAIISYLNGTFTLLHTIISLLQQV